MKLTALCAMICVVWVPLAVFAEPGGTPACEFTGSPPDPYVDASGNPSNRMYVYIENDFNVEMRASTPSTADATLTIGQVKHAIMQAAEIWNTQARGPALVWGGLVVADDPDEFCALAVQRPGLFIRFEEAAYANGTANVGWGGCMPLGSSKMMTFWQKKPGQPNNEWPIGSQGSTFVDTAIHEFGHVLNLDHGHEASPPTCYSVTAYPSLCGADSGGRHLGTYDKDCVDQWQTSPRATVGRLRGISASGAFGGFYSFAYGMRQGFFGANAIRRSGGFGYLTYFDYTARSTAAGSDGYFSWSSFSGGIPDIANLDVGPTIFSPRDFGWSTSSNGVRFSFLDDEYDSTPSVYLNPPYVQYVRTDDTLSWSSGDHTLYDCQGSGGACGSSVPVRSHLPVATAWDPVSGVTVLAVVTTESISDPQSDGDGRIKLHPGFFESGNYSRIRGGTHVGGSLGGTWPATATTDQPVGLACADTQWPSSYNCLLAWVDKDQYQGAIRYTYFRVTGSHSIQFNGSWTTRSGAETAAGPTVAYIDDHFWMAYRDLEQQNITYQRSDSPYSWWIAGYEGGHFPIISGPTFMFNHGQEAGLYFASGM